MIAMPALTHPRPLLTMPLPATAEATPAVAARLPPLPCALRAGTGRDDLSAGQRRWMVSGVVLAHLAGAWGLMQIGAVREAVQQAAPIFVQMMAAPAPPVPPASPPPTRTPIRPVTAEPPPTAAVMAAAPSPAPAPFVVAAPPEPTPPAPPGAAPAAVGVVAAPAPPAPPTPPPAPKLIPAGAVQYLVAPMPAYPRLSERNKEIGRVVVRATIGIDGGAPRQVVVHQSSGHARLDDAALVAVQKARFRPPTENGRPVEGWALIPIDFEPPEK